MVADADGIVAVPLKKAHDIAAELARITESEQGMRTQAKQAPTK